VKLGIVQLNPTVGDLEGNVDRCLEGIAQAAKLGAELIVLPEMAVPGCHPKDILLDANFIHAVAEATVDLAAEAQDFPPAIVGTVLPTETPPGLHNAAILLEGGTPRLLAAKQHLPNVDVFFESRWFAPGTPPAVHLLAGKNIGVLVGGELEPPTFETQPDFIVNLAASPFYHDVWDERLNYARSLPAALVYANLVGANDEIIYDGRSFATDGDHTAVLPGFEESVQVVDLARLTDSAHMTDDMQAVKSALVLGIRDFARKNGIQQAFLGLSGGIDSCVVAALAAEALSPAQVTGVAMPSRYTDPRSTWAAEQLANNLGIGF
jgi:NAD+ synthase (glutamine-hydrolysing)